MTTIFYGVDFGKPVSTGKTSSCKDSIEVNLGDETISLDTKFALNRLFVLGQLASVLINEQLEALYIPIEFADHGNNFLTAQWEQFGAGRKKETLEIPSAEESEMYAELSSALAKYRRAGLMLHKTSEGATVEIVEIELQ